ncbi:gamma-glutamyltransferase family protein [Thalassospira indica]|uniref:Gamma-glutamyltransferase family protein n=1 Tax=Thalassospira indica TaxID=1891279 RepID=A0ABM6Y226_9PROT|nr:gamma-glutamyltransferase family protein [Thalassospira indica]AXO15255.1 gamma-glutamyltransferase family protein [Thalassospira indica]OAZ08715.1 gamma-glutamyltransferase [Thalassospira profundimaris]
MLRSRTALGGMVTAPHHLAAEAGRDILREGGNAVEAMIAAAATIAVVYPHMNAIGGDGFWLISEPGKDPVAIRACGGAANLATPDFYREQGHAAIPARGPLAALTVAGAIGGWIKAAEVARTLGGKISQSRLMADAVHHAKTGVPITKSQVALTTTKMAELKDSPGYVETYAANGIPAIGDVLRQPALGATLEHLGRAGFDDFYRGDIAQTNARGLEAAGSPLRLADFEAYHAKTMTPLSVKLSSGTVFNMVPPTQGVASLMILGLYDRLGQGAAQVDSFDHIHGLVEATKRAFLKRDAHIGDPDRMRIDPMALLSDEMLDAEAAKIDMENALSWPHVAKPGDTIWMGAVDANGVAVSYIQSIFWEFGSGVVVPETGVLWQNRGASFTLHDGPNQLGAGRLPFHTLNPALAKLNDGSVLTYGTMGGEGQPQTQSAVFTRHVLYGQDLQEAITAPRWLLGKTWGEDTTTLKLENRFDPALIEQLKSAGHTVELVGSYEDMMGHAGGIRLRKDGVMEGANDPRADGSVSAI